MAAQEPQVKQQPQPPAVEPDGNSNAGHMQLKGWRLTVAQLAWTLFALINLVAYLSGVTHVYAIASNLSPPGVAYLAAAGLPPNFSALYLIALDTATFAVFGIVALVIFKRRSDDPMALLASTMLIFTAMLYTTPGYEAQAPLPIIALGITLGELSQIAFLQTFPNGRFYPRHSWLILPLFFLWRMAIWTLVYLPGFYGTERTGDRYPIMRQNAVDLGLFILLFLLAVVLQIRRYRRMSNAVQRQQAKWLVWGVAVAVLIGGGYALALSTLSFMQSTDPNAVMLRLLGRTVRQIALCIIPITIMYSILRFNLWGIDLLINRTLVYVPLTSILAGIYAATITLTQSFFIAATGQKSDAAIVVTTLVLTATFMPIKDELVKFVERHLKEAPDPSRRLTAFDRQVRSIAEVLDVQLLLHRLLEESMQAFSAVGGAVFLAEQGQPRLVHSSEKWVGPATLQLSIESEEACVGWLALGARRGGADYPPKALQQLQNTLHEVARVIVLVSPKDSTSYLPQRETGGMSKMSEIVLPLPMEAGIHHNVP